jgi:hypothetical protein
LGRERNSTIKRRAATKQKNKMNKNFIIYHQVKKGTDCPDGIAAAWIAAKAHGYHTKLVPEIYRSEGAWEEYELPFDPTDAKIVFVDWAGYPDYLFQSIALQASEVIVLDHHGSRGKELIELSDRLDGFFPGYAPNEVACGSTLTWDYFFPAEDRPWFLKYIRTRDTGMGGYWQGKLPKHEAVNAAISRMRRGKVGIEAFCVFDELLEEPELEKTFAESGLPDVEAKNDLAWQEVNWWRENRQYIRLDERFSFLYKGGDEVLPEVPYLEMKDPNCDRHYSWVGTYLSEIHPTAPFVVIVTATEPRTMHLRKPHNSRTDCGAIAKQFGGGGHAAAAGFSLNG